MDSQNQIPFGLPGFRIVQVEEGTEFLRIEAHSLTVRAICPDCQCPTVSVHCTYTRIPKDLPSSDRELRLVLQVKRFRCVNRHCPRKTFAERIPEIVPLHGQRTERLTRKLRLMVRETSAEGCARQTQCLRVPVSGDTLLRIQRQVPGAQPQTPRVLGIDDWAVRKGVSYGSILVDLERNEVIDLLPDRRVETARAWLSRPPDIEIVSRDRSNAYKAAITEALPDAVQVADCWHLAKNLGDALQTLLKRYVRELKQVAYERAGYARTTVELAVSAAEKPDRQPSRKELRFQEVKRLAGEGLSQRQMAIQLQMSRITVKKYLSLESLPGYGPRQARPTILDPYRTYLEIRWDEGCHNARILTEEIQAQGYQGGVATARRFLPPRRRQKYKRTDAWPPPVSIPSPRQIAVHLYLPSERLEPDQVLFREALCLTVPEIALAYNLAQRFRVMLQDQQLGCFDAWIQDTLRSGIRSLAAFARGLLQDEEAVRAALIFPWSTGPVEGQINRLKTIKRMMYGRAKFDLLRIRVLAPP